MEVVVEEDAGAGIDGRGFLLVDEIARDELFLGVSKNSLHLALGGGLEGSEDFVLGSSLFRSESQIDDGNIGGRNLLMVLNK